MKNNNLITENLTSNSRIDEIDVSKNIGLIKSIVKNLTNKLKNNKDITSLSSLHINKNVRLFLYKVDKQIKVIINPIIIDKKDTKLSRETQVGVKGEYIIPRFNEITLGYQTEKGETKVETFIGGSSCIIQQNTDLLDGVLLNDIGLELIEGWDEATDKEKQQVLDRYIVGLEHLEEVINGEKETNSKLKLLSDNIENLTKQFINNYNKNKSFIDTTD